MSLKILTLVLLIDQVTENIY